MIKTRFAPSPTGDLHIGSLRTALFEYLTAKKGNGQFLLRIEDTDQARYKEGSVDSILQGLEWVGIVPDNKDSIIYQSKRTRIYQKYVDRLIEQGHAYRCFCSSQRLDEMRKKQQKNKQAPRYDRHCMSLTEEEVQEKIKAGEKFVVRMKVPERTLDGGDKLAFSDLIRGKVEVSLKEIDDQVLLKSDGFPTYHLANIVDDHEMEISHVIRAEEWLPSTPKHILLYQMLDWIPPRFAHVPMVLATDKSKLSKRHGATSVLEFKKLGFLPEAIVNYLALLGWNPGDDREHFNLSELEKVFSLEKVQKSGAVFDIEKLKWMNSHYIKESDLDKLTVDSIPFLVEKGLVEEKEYDLDFLKGIVALEQQRVKTLAEIPQAVEYFFTSPDYDPAILVWKKSDQETAKSRLEFLKSELEKVPVENWTRSALEQLLLPLIESKELGNGDTLWPMRVSLTGREKSPSPFEVAEVLGKPETLKRIEKGVELL